jgi:hypothetical protein
MLPALPPLAFTCLLLVAPSAFAGPSASDDARDTPSDAGAKADPPASEVAERRLAFERFHLTFDGSALVDRLEPGGVATAAELSFGYTWLLGFAKSSLVLLAGHGPATPQYCGPCGGTRIEVPRSLGLAGVLFNAELHLPYGPLRPFAGIAVGVALGGSLRQLSGLSALHVLRPRIGVEAPLGKVVALRLFGGFDSVTGRWVMGEAYPTFDVDRQSPTHLRWMLGAGLTSYF